MSATPSTPAVRRQWVMLAALLIMLGLLGHLLAARAIGGTQLAFRDHIFGFVLILVVTGGIIAALGWRFWKGRTDLTLLAIGAVQLLFGIYVYIERFSVHG